MQLCHNNNCNSLLTNKPGSGMDGMTILSAISVNDKSNKQQSRLMVADVGFLDYHNRSHGIDPIYV